MVFKFSTFLLLAPLCACQAVASSAGTPNAETASDAQVDTESMDADAHDACPAVNCLGSPDGDASSAQGEDSAAGGHDAMTTANDVAGLAAKDPAFDAPMDPNVDQLMQVPASEIDLSKDFVLTPDTVVPVLQNFYAWGLQPGQQVPDFTLWSLEGKLVSLSDWKNKSNVLVVMGTPSCGEFRNSFRPRLPAFQAYVDAITAQTGEKLQVLLVLNKEAHPAIDPSPYVGVQWTGADNVADKILVRQPTTYGTRVLNGRAYVQRYKMNAAQFLVDGMDNAVWQQFGQLSNTAHLIDKNGVLVWKEPWALQAGKSEQDPTVKPELYAQVAKLLGAKP